jgi:hypothetical protein
MNRAWESRNSPQDVALLRILIEENENFGETLENSTTIKSLTSLRIIKNQPRASPIDEHKKFHLRPLVIITQTNKKKFPQAATVSKFRSKSLRLLTI